MLKDGLGGCKSKATTTPAELNTFNIMESIDYELYSFDFEYMHQIVIFGFCKLQACYIIIFSNKSRV
jgi:hypothetical protein